MTSLPHSAVLAPASERPPLLQQSLLLLLAGALASALLGYFCHDLGQLLLAAVPHVSRGYLLFALVLAPLVLAMVLTEILLLRSLREMVRRSESYADNPSLLLL